MNFLSLFQYVIDRYPDSIDISDGVTVEETGFRSNNLIDAWEKTESGVTSSAEGYLVWAIYRILHAEAKELFQAGKVKLDVKGIWCSPLIELTKPLLLPLV